MEQTNALAPSEGDIAHQLFDLSQREAKAWSASSMLPDTYRNNVPNCIIALDAAKRLGISPLQVMQHLYIVHGRPGWSSTFLIAAVNACGRFSPLRYEEKGEGSTYAMRAYAIDKSNNERLNGTWITAEMVEGEGWAKKAGSKWKTMPEQMYRYRAAAFWQRAYASEISMGFGIKEELEDAKPEPPKGTMTVRLSPKQMEQVRNEIASGNATPDDVVERNPNLPADQVEEIMNMQSA